MDKEYSNGKMEVSIKENFLTIIFMVKEFIYGLMVENMMETGNSIKWMAMVFSPGLTMEEDRNTKESILKIKDKDLELSFGLMEEYTVEIGSMESKMEREL